MAIEIERKFLILNDRLPDLESGTAIKQGYIPTANGTSIRVRLAGEQAFFCLKSPFQNFSRLEYEYLIPLSDGQDMLDLFCGEQLIEKHRYRIHEQNMLWELDIFSGLNHGLAVAEIELESEEQSFDLPGWVGEEVTHDNRYSNYSLAKHPFSNWQH